MGLWSRSSPAPEQSKTSDGGFIAPDRSARAQCWDGRDSFFACLDQNGIIDSQKEDAKARHVCGKELAQFEHACKESWVTYFKKRRVMEHQRDATIKKLSAEGATGMSASDVTGNGATTFSGR